MNTVPRARWLSLAVVFCCGICRAPAADTERRLSVDWTWHAKPLREVIALFAAKLGTDYLIAGDVSGAVTLTLQQEMTRADLWELFDFVLAQNGAFSSRRNRLITVRRKAGMAQDRVRARTPAQDTRQISREPETRD